MQQQQLQAAQKSTSRSGRSQSCVRVPSGWPGPGWSSGEAPVQYGENRRQLAPLLPCYPHPRPGPHTRTPDLCRPHTNTRELGPIPLFMEDSPEGFVCLIPSTVSVLKREEQFQKLRSPFPTHEFLEGKSQKDEGGAPCYINRHILLVMFRFYATAVC